MEVQDPTKVRLLEAAGEEFACKGFDAARIRTICERAGANVAAVNYHFGDKEQLYLQALLEAHRCGAVAMAPDEEFFVGSPADQLRRFIRAFVGHVLMDPEPAVRTVPEPAAAPLQVPSPAPRRKRARGRARPAVRPGRA